MLAIEKYRVGTSFPIGQALLINIKTFQNDPEKKRTRHGSEKDMRNLKRVLEHLQFKVNARTDLTKMGISKAVEKFVAELNANPVDICFVCIMSHGDKDCLISRDNQEVYPEEDILEKFSNSHCSSMRGHPKIFLFQSCRGEKRETMRDDAHPPVSSKLLFTSTLRDAIIAYSTVPGFVAYRGDTGRNATSSQDGSWFIEAFCQVFTQATDDIEVQRLFKHVSQELSKMKTGLTGQKKQTMEVVYRSFEKDLFLETANKIKSTPNCDKISKQTQTAVPDVNLQDFSINICMLLLQFLRNLFFAPVAITETIENVDNGQITIDMLYSMEQKKNHAQTDYEAAIQRFDKREVEDPLSEKEAVAHLKMAWNVLKTMWMDLLNAKNDYGSVIRKIDQKTFIKLEHEHEMKMLEIE